MSARKQCVIFLFAVTILLLCSCLFVGSLHNETTTKEEATVVRATKIQEANTPLPFVVPTNTPPRPTGTATLLLTKDTPVPTETPVPSTVVCDCSSDLYNCSDFRSHTQAQACYDYCKAEGCGDVHRLDRDNDGLVCE